MPVEPNHNLADPKPGNEGGNALNINYYNVKKASLVLRSLNHKLRQQIIKIIHESDKLAVTDIYIKLRLEQSVASQHLAILRKAGIVSTKREGKFIYYTINRKKVDTLDDLVGKLVS